MTPRRRRAGLRDLSVRLPGRRAAKTTGIWLGALAVSAAGGHQLLRAQARLARRAIGKPLGETAHRADKLYKKKYGDPVDLLMLGDSIAAGLGADKSKHTLGAQLARRLAKRLKRSVRLYTGAHVGSETSMLRAQLAALPPRYRPDVAVIVVGGNDVTHRVRTAESKAHLAEAVSSLRAQGTEVVVGTCPDLGALGPLPQPLRSLGRLASRRLAAAQHEVVTALGGHSVSLADVVGPFFLAQPEEMFAVDRFHPSSAGYRRTAKAMLPTLAAAVSGKRDGAEPRCDGGRSGRGPSPVGEHLVQ
jgi:lysophospholipase L1-like esterase